MGGPSAGQSTMIVMFDIFLGVSECHRNEAKAFQLEMMGYMPAAHRRIVEDLATKLDTVGSVRSYLADDRGSLAVREAYDAALVALRQFRSFHLGVATRYLIKTGKGTGDSDFRSLLSKCVEATQQAVAS